jgi:hypothetical protein
MYNRQNNGGTFLLLVLPGHLIIVLFFVGEFMFYAVKLILITTNDDRK